MYFFPVILLYKHHCTMQNQLFPQRTLKSADLVFSLQLNEMIRNPGEGHFWQVDHIKPVFSGGGQCSLDNLQTLCTVCHKEVSELSDTCDCPGPSNRKLCIQVWKILRVNLYPWSGIQNAFYSFHHLTLVFPLETYVSSQSQMEEKAAYLLIQLQDQEIFTITKKKMNTTYNLQS